jgi:adenylosuccinate lyase
MLFRGMTRLMTESQQKRIDDMYNDVITGVYESVCEQAIIPEFIPLTMHGIEKTFNALRMIQVDPDIIEDIIYDTDEVWSERKTYTRLRKFSYNTERPKIPIHVSRKRANRGHGWKRW